MLINAQRPEELRIAIVRDRSLENFQVDIAEAGLTRGNIYRGTIANIQPSLNAAFIDYGAERHGFLAIQDVVPEAYYHAPRGGHPRIEDVLTKGKPIVVQVVKEAIGQKGAALTTSLSLAGRYLVLTPFDDTRGVSRKVEDEDVRKKLRQLAANLEIPKGCGVIVRTNALDQNKTALSRDLAALLRLWKKVQTAALTGKGSRLLYSDQDLIVQALRDHLDSSIEEVLVDDDAAFDKAAAYMQAFMPRSKTRLTRYDDRLPLFARFDLESQIERIYERRVDLPSGGSIVIEATEALTAIDVNSGRSTRAATQEETALHTNLEAAAEVGRQLRLRDLGGLVVVDFIDMRASKNQRKVEKAMRDAMKEDKARSSVGRISSNGLLEINRQRIKQALQVRTHRPCPTCDGTGRLASPEMVTLNLLRRIEGRAASGMVQKVRIGLHPELADALQNDRRRELAALEEEFDLKIEIIAAAGLHRPDEQVEWFHRDKPFTPPPRPKAPPKSLQAWDVTLDEDDEEEEETPPPRGGGSSTRRGSEAQPAPAGEEGGGKRRKRRRGGRKRRKGGTATDGNGHDGAAEGHGDPDTEHWDALPFPGAHGEDEEPVLFFGAPADDVETTLEAHGEPPEDWDDEEAPEETAAGPDENGEGGERRKRSRRRRRRRGGAGREAREGRGAEAGEKGVGENAAPEPLDLVPAPAPGPVESVPESEVPPGIPEELAVPTEPLPEPQDELPSTEELLPEPEVELPSMTEPLPEAEDELPGAEKEAVEETVGALPDAGEDALTDRR